MSGRSTAPILLSACLLGSPFAARADEQVRRQEHVEVDRVLVDVRVLDGGGQPVRGLVQPDFRLEVDGRPVAIESVRWIEQAAARAGSPAPDVGAAPDREAQAPELPDRLLLLLFQKDVGQSSRLSGLLRMQRYARDLIDRLGPHDRVAVASHDSRLHVWLDFTADRAAARWAIEHSVVRGRPVPDEPRGEPLLRRALNVKAAREAASPEAALKALGEALEPLPGTKALLLFGWGMGTLEATGVRMTHDYQPALDALSRAGASVFSLDITDADWHSLEVGLQQVAQDTGGTYARTHLFPATAVRQIEAALSGHYLLSFQRPELPRGEHRMRVRLWGHRGTVLARATYLDPQ